MSIKGIKPGETPLNFLLDIINEQQSESERIEAIINAIGHSEKNKDTLIISMLLAVTRFYSANGGNIINPGYGNFSPPENDDEMNMRLTKLLKQNNYHKTSDRAQAKKEYDHTHALLSEAIKSPLFDRYTGVVWHGCHISVAENMINKKENINFPGFMSTTYDPDVAMSYASKGALLVIKINEPAGSLIEGISSAPNEKELLFDKEAKFSVEASYILHLEKGYPPNCKTNMQKRIFDLKVSKGEVQPYAQVEIIPDDKSNHQTEESDEETNLQYIKQIADHIKTKVSSLDEDMRIVILQKNADDKISEYKQDVGHMDSHDISPHNILAEIFHNRIRRHTFYDLQIPAPDFNVKENHQNSNSTGYFGNQYTEELNEQSQAIPVMPERIINKPKRKLSL